MKFTINFPSIAVAAWMLFPCSAEAQSFLARTETRSAGEVRVECEDTGGWEFGTSLEQKDGKEFIKVSLTRKNPSNPPAFRLRLEIPQKDIHNFWSAGADFPRLNPDWDGRYSSQLARGIPVYEFFNDNNLNRLTMAVDDPFRQIDLKAGIQEESSLAIAEFSFFNTPEAPLESYGVTVMLDARPVFWSESISAASEWISGRTGAGPCDAPEAAFEPLYSTWYQFHQEVSAKAVEEEAAIAAEMGMKTLILDDGWQTDDANRSYSHCGDWDASASKFPDMAAHVRKVKAAGLEYMVWYAVPFVGMDSRNYERFKGKYIYLNEGFRVGVLDPRFPEVRDFLAGIYEKALKEWDLDGFKLDFIGSFITKGEDPAVSENYAGRDVKSIPEAVDILMKAITGRLRSIKPDILIEFRQGYIGPAIRQYGNMFRAADCPGSIRANRIRTTNLRLTSGSTAVHSDMLEWNVDDTPENAARSIISSIFSVIQYSVMLRDLPQAHKDIISNWLKFSLTHRNTLLKGKFRPYHSEAGYPLIEASSDEETIMAVYQDDVTVCVGRNDGKPVYILNGSGEENVVVDMRYRAEEAVVTDAYGHSKSVNVPGKGLDRIQIPAGGYLMLK